VLNNRTVLISEGGGISIGKDCLIGTSLQIYDTDFHTTDPALRHKEVPKPCRVIVGDNVFIGSDVTILKGVHIGNNCVVGAGSVVTKSFPDNLLIAGNPASKIRNL
jgi:maltose O-acetyltransferase